MEASARDRTGRGCRKRKADSLGRIASSSSSCQGGRGALVGWTPCPLCGRHSKKLYALGRGIASHLHAVHKPWNPGKVERKKRRRLAERHRAEKKRAPTRDSDEEGEDDNSTIQLECWEPSQEEIAAWDEEVLNIVAKLEREAVNQELTVGKVVGAGFDRNGKESRPYRDSLPAFIRAAADGDFEALKGMVAEEEAKGGDAVLGLLDSRDRHLSSAEHWSAGGGHLSCLRYLLETRQMYSTKQSREDSKEDDLSVKKTRRRDGKTCLHYAARNGHLDCIRFLIDDYGHPVDELSGDGTTPFHMACFGGHFHVAEFLIEKGADAKATNNWGCSAAHWLAMTRCQSEEKVRRLCCLLQNTGVSFIDRQKQGHSALHKAAQRLNRHVILWMVEENNDGGAGLSIEEKQQAGRADHGGHIPSEIWLSVGGDKAFAKRMRDEWHW